MMLEKYAGFRVRCSEKTMIMVIAFHMVFNNED